MHPFLQEDCHQQIIWGKFNLKIIYPSTSEELFGTTNMTTRILLSK